MIRYSTSRIHNGKRVSKGDLVDAPGYQVEALIDCGQAYDEGKDKPDKSNNIKELKAYMSSEGIYFSSTMAKGELLQQIDDFERNSNISE